MLPTGRVGGVTTVGRAGDTGAETGARSSRATEGVVVFAGVVLAGVDAAGFAGVDAAGFAGVALAGVDGARSSRALEGAGVDFAGVAFAGVDAAGFAGVDFAGAEDEDFGPA